MATNSIALTINGKPHRVAAGTTVSAAVLNAGIGTFRRSVTGQPRAALCGMGICFECRLTINGRTHQRSCQILVTEGMEVVTDV